MVLFKRLVIVAAISVFGTSAHALTMQECRAQYKADAAAKVLHLAWVDYQVKRCGIDPKASVPTPSPAAPVKH
ncbi:hypothetical protein QA640_45320 (plasmid) [Bradyrhizobium sp. CB82]|uniref:hypothetical protein n=1 Tax=Bradyrhizobium sp. CB82 TaxID=3039159 RepID=UPI0024B044BE|nr:hypothetical protein [Bradyrhizobium sp. CB82]WFU46001.1 hypothetical protein QA640_45320 [Bradyrhizobium sp. CB82]